MPMWANGSRRGSRRVWYCKQLRIFSANNIFSFVKHVSGNIFFVYFASILDFIGVHITAANLKWSPYLGVLNFRLEALELEFWIVHHSSIHHHSHCYWIPLTAMMEWVASVIWGRAKTGTAVSRYSWVLMEMRILKTNNYHKDIEGKQCCFQVRF